MQTFLPCPDFATTARILDRLRLGKQRVETLPVERALHRRHESALMRKDPEQYRRYFPGVPDDLPTCGRRRSPAR